MSAVPSSLAAVDVLVDQQVRTDAENQRLRQDLTTAKALLSSIYDLCDDVYDGESRAPLMSLVCDIMTIADRGRLR